MEDIIRLAPAAIEKIYSKIVNELTIAQWREIRTPEYWKERDELYDLLAKKVVTIKYYERYKNRIRR